MSRRTVFAVALHASPALAISLATVVVQDRSDEVAVYGNMGTLWENVRPRVVGGWPAPFLADSSATSVPFQLGLEDEFRFGPFVATLGFWYLVVGLLRDLIARLASRRTRAAD